MPEEGVVRRRQHPDKSAYDRVYDRKQEDYRDKVEEALIRRISADSLEGLGRIAQEIDIFLRNRELFNRFVIIGEMIIAVGIRIGM